MTDLLYLKDQTLLETEAGITDVLSEEGRSVLTLNQTIFYPQGGGQPYDRGIIKSLSGKFIVEEVRFNNGLVKHIGRFGNGAFKKGDTVICQIDKERRELNSRIHSAGHLIDLIIAKLNLNWIPTKGYHFPEGPYIEYVGNLNETEREKLKTEIERLSNELIQKGEDIKFLFVDKNQLQSLCHFIPDNLPTDKPTRVVLFGDFGTPCGGTHVFNLSEIEKITIRKIKLDNQNIRVAYDILK